MTRNESGFSPVAIVGGYHAGPPIFLKSERIGFLYTTGSLIQSTSGALRCLASEIGCALDVALSGIFGVLRVRAERASEAAFLVLAGNLIGQDVFLPPL